MKTKVIQDEHIQGNSSTDATQLVQLLNDTGSHVRTFKFTYSNGNAFEKFKIELFDGTQLNHIASMCDLGVMPNSSLYVHNQFEKRERSDKLMKLGYKYIKLLY